MTRHPSILAKKAKGHRRCVGPGTGPAPPAAAAAAAVAAPVPVPEPVPAPAAPAAPPAAKKTCGVYGIKDGGCTMIQKMGYDCRTETNEEVMTRHPSILAKKAKGHRRCVGPGTGPAPPAAAAAAAVAAPVLRKIRRLRARRTCNGCPVLKGYCQNGIRMNDERCVACRRGGCF